MIKKINDLKNYIIDDRASNDLLNLKLKANICRFK